MPNIRRIASKTAQYLRRRIQTLEGSLASSVVGVARKEIFDGYIINVRKTDNGTIADLLEPPAFLCLVGRFVLQDGEQDPDKSYIQSLRDGRDSYYPIGLTSQLDPQLNPLLLAGPFADLSLGSIAVTGNRQPWRFWGVAQPFIGVGCVYGYGAVYLTNDSQRWSLTWGKLTDSFVYRLVMEAPNAIRYQTIDGKETAIPEEPGALAAGWTLEISESVLSGFGAVAFTRFEGDDPTYGLPESDSSEANWETAQYPWFTFTKPKKFQDPDGDTGFKVTVCALVVYDYGGPYAQTIPDNTNGWGEVDFGSPAGGRGLWVAEIQVIKGVASILHQYKVYAGEEHRTPLLIDHRGAPVDFANRWYADNVVYKVTPAALDTGMTIMASVSYVDRTQQVVGEPVLFYEGYLFLDVHWFQDGLHRSQNITTSALTRTVFVPSDEGEVQGNYVAHLTAFDAGMDEGRFAIGAATDGTLVVMPVFSSFRPGSSPRLQVLVANKDSVTVGYDGVPGFAMMMSLGLDEEVDIQYVEHPNVTDNQTKFWTLPAGTDQVSYIGNQRYAFFISTEWTTPGDDDFGFVPNANAALAVYDASAGHVSVLGVIDPGMGNSGLSPHANPVGATLTQVYFSRRLGRIEVVRPESDGYKAAGPGQEQVGHPATLIVTSGRGNAGWSLQSGDVQDIKDGATTISYDSGKTWTVFLGYGSPAGAFHCGSITQPRSEPVVRI